ncbi:FG-GAP repeat domain-containing protein [Aquihabitans daechungensis]|uniref:FG-GAP repeat domain-containing protein n=1 Tax=Aquihabitans daechungensis TaxID=1052257 RepID=UPI003B9ED252
MVRSLVAGLALVVATQLLPAAGGAQDGTASESAELPVGFTDGVPVGGASGPEGEVAPDRNAPASTSASRAASTRYFGRGPWAAIERAAESVGGPCAISTNGKVAMAVSPVFKESGAGTSAATVPAPMTLSRYDEWTGVLDGTTNRNANYGLYAFRNPDTPYKRAFWHPGIGIWQYDSAGVGAPFTAVERMDVSIVARDVVAGMSARYCNPSSATVGHSAPFSDLERRYSAWAPWGYPCTLCEQEFQNLTSGTDFAAVSLVDGISQEGGMQARTCTLRGVSGTVRCWYIDPSVGVIEGATAWARLEPLDGGSPTSTPTPIAEAFYVVDRGATEERHWLRADTGYGIDVSGSRQIGKNERPRSNQTGSGVTWTASSGLCDLNTGRGACLPPAPPGMTLTESPVTGTFRPIALDAQGDDRGDVLWYAPGSTKDYLWSGGGSGAFTATTLNIGGTYDDVLPLDVDADGDDDVLWYNRSTGGAYLWVAGGTGSWQAVKLTRPKGLRPLVVDTDGNGRDEVFWYGPGSLADSLWSWNGSSFTTRSQSVGGSYLGLPGDFDGNGKDDVLWYGPGAAADHLWLSTDAGRHRDITISVGGSYLPLIGDLEGDGNDDVFWYGPGSAADNVWFGAPGGGFERRTVAVNGRYQPKVADLGGDGRDDVIWYAPGPPTDVWWRWGADRTVASTTLIADGPHQAVVGGFSAGGADGILWYAAGITPDGVWWR